MYLPQFVVGMFVTSAIVAVWTYAVTGSVWTALGWAIIDLVVLQVGYFVFVIRLVYKGATADAEPDSASLSHVSPPQRDGKLL
ncbi:MULTISPECIES: exopolysaccharide production repressor protein [unclassified Mesorhizobium]|jgi:exopolysaccharide production repressor protein|uniref:exopolysaccharide production repressor protein n=1 Tax=unclassified Mesorhizobium TaxID=325217 RepID=UPI000F750ADC|nr:MULTISPECIES: exopolysaccharide production repressor protein [unclassified Mesorhizobium]AZO41783.1 hypothetical protein EJ076_12185 [Mesorhizobium sp. M7D.F.Ca.US.005.01.1.1]RUX94012.1 hypothetical protein EN993_17345 [Mesorhizobium sp. M7D.F.Ca.US.004.01.2.1]RVA35820.1 hypothetical protein EN935_03625 [Mesorhizobium sp. M7D.F.Ca.US.004.03.1.1]